MAQKMVTVVGGPPPPPVVVVGKDSSSKDARTEYIEQLQREACYPSVPSIEVRYCFSYTINLPLKQV